MKAEQKAWEVKHTVDADTKKHEITCSEAFSDEAVHATLAESQVARPNDVA